MNLKCVNVVRAALGDPAKSSGHEILYRCPGHDDRHPSLRINTEKNLWLCGPCNVSGNAWELAAFLGGYDPADKITIAEWLGARGLSYRNAGAPRRIRQHSYKDANGRDCRKVRLEPKAFLWEHRGADGRWKLGLDGGKPLPYRLHEVRLGSGTIFVSESEHDVDVLWEHGLAAAAGPYGSNAEKSWPPENIEQLRGMGVAIPRHNDTAGSRFAETLASKLHGVASEVKVILLPGLPKGGDVVDWFAAGHTDEDLLRLVAETPAWVPPSQSDVGTGEDARCGDANTAQGPSVDSRTGGNNSESMATRLVTLADGINLFHTRDGIGYANLTVGDHIETWGVRSLQFKRNLTKKLYDGEGLAPSAQGLRDAIATIDAKANFDGPEQEVFVRVAEFDGAIYLDLADKQWRAVCVTESGWMVIESPPVRFRRTRGMLPLPEPVRGGTIDELDKFINVRNDDKPLVRAWTSAAMMPRGPYPILNVHGEQGSAKSTTQRVLRALVDPNKSPLRTLPRDERDLQIAANNSHLLGFDNASYLQPWLSDAFCRLATGGGFATRELYTDQDEVIFEAQRPVLLNGIEDLAARGDYLQRSIVLYLPEIAETARRYEGEFWPAFEEAQPRILGAFLDAMVVGLRNKDTVNLASKPRMADFAHWAVAAEAALGIKSGAFLLAYCDNAGDANALALESSVIASHICAFLEDHNDWTGTAAELLKEINARAGDNLTREKGWPRTARALSGALRRLAPNLRAIGIQITFLERESHRRPIKLTKVVEQPSPPTEPSREPRSAESAAPEPSCVPSAESSHLNPSVQRYDDGCDGHDDTAAPVEVEL